MRIIIGEQGLLKIRKEKGTLQPKVLYWQDMVIVPMRIPWRQYYLFSQKNEKYSTYLTLNYSYEKLDELVALIQRLSNTGKIRTRT